MPEMPNVVLDEVVESEWGNAIRDRTIQRYTDATERSALHASPTAGDLSFLEDTGLVYVYFGGNWIRVGGPEETDATGFTSSVTTTTSLTALVGATLTIPAHWDEWRGVAWANWMAETSTASPSVVDCLIRFGGVDGTTNVFNALAPAPSSLVARRTGINTTGSFAVDLRAKHTAPNPAIFRTVLVYARAVRTL